MTDLEQLNLFAPPPLRSAATRRAARIARDRGIKRAEDSSGAEWQERAYAFLLGWLAERSTPFQACEVRHAAKGIVRRPPEPRSWGPVMLRAYKAGLVLKAGNEPDLDPKSHRSPANLWVKA